MIHLVISTFTVLNHNITDKTVSVWNFQRVIRRGTSATSIPNFKSFYPQFIYILRSHRLGGDWPHRHLTQRHRFKKFSFSLIRAVCKRMKFPWLRLRLKFWNRNYLEPNNGTQPKRIPDGNFKYIWLIRPQIFTTTNDSQYFPPWSFFHNFCMGPFVIGTNVLGLVSVRSVVT